MPNTAIAIPCCRGGNDSRRIDCEIGWSAPPPIPCKILKKMRLVRLQAAPHKKELTVKRLIENIKYRFRPKTLLSQPVMGIMTAFETRYDVMVQVDSSTPAERLPRMWTSATLTTDVSTISMRVGSITVIAIIHLFINTPEGWKFVGLEDSRLDSGMSTL